jgi:rubrerythrin
MTDVKVKEFPTQWKCGNCGIVLEVPAPPKMCPSCHTVCEFLNVTCYEPDCEPTGIDKRLK